MLKSCYSGRNAGYLLQNRSFRGNSGVVLFLYTFAAFALFFLLAGVGYIIQHKMIHGSCGGLANAGIEKACSCEKPCFKRRVVTKIKSLTGKDSGQS